MYGYYFLAAAAIISQECFFDKDKVSEIRQGLPKIGSESLEKVFLSNSVKFYDTKTIPMAYQDFRGSLRGIHSPFYNISANRSEPHGNGNIEFPWGKPAGTHRTEGVSSVKFINLPKDKSGDTIPIIYEYVAGDGYNWVFPRSTVIGEILYNEGVCFEIRTRTKGQGNWIIDVLRPFNTGKELKEQIAVSYPRYKSDSELTALYDAIDKVDDGYMVLEDTQPNRRVFSSKVKRITLPGISKDKAFTLLSNKKFTSALGTTWSSHEDDPILPTIDSGYGIVPAKYDADFVQVSTKSCARCHDSTNMHVDNFNFTRDWYGKVRGSDGIFSFHIFDRGCISYNGIGQGVSINKDLTDIGFISPRPAVVEKAIYTDVNRR